MYLDYFKFTKSPFHITHDPNFLFLSKSQKEASAAICYGIETRKGLVTLTGEVGAGKTTLLRSYMEGVDPEKIRIVYIFNATLPFDTLLQQICSESGIEVAGLDSAELVDTLFHHLIEEYKKDRNIVLIVDEAQNMRIETLERVRMLSNLESSQVKLMQMILVGRPEFEARLNLPELRQMGQRVAIRARIAPLTAEESLSYIQHRIMEASLFHNRVFTQKALELIVEEARGIPRRLNILCDNALVAGFGYQRKPVDVNIVREVLRDFRGARPRSGSSRKIGWRRAAAAGVAVALIASANLAYHRLGIPTPGEKDPGRSLPARVPETAGIRRTESARRDSVSGSKRAPAFESESALSPLAAAPAAGGIQPGLQKAPESVDPSRLHRQIPAPRAGRIGR